jgi:hypothetical protein
MSETKKHYLLATVIDDFISDNSLHSSFWMKALKWGQRAVRQIRLDTFQHPCTSLLTVTERRTVVCPDGMVDWTKIAVKRGQYAITLAVNDDLTINKRTDSEQVVRGLLSQNMPNGTDMSNYGGYTMYNYSGSDLFCAGQGLPGKGFFKVVDHGGCKEILLDFDYRYSQVYLEYITDGLDACKETVIHPYEYDYILAFIEMMYAKKNDPKATVNSKYEAERDVFFEEKKMRARYNDLTPKDILTMSRAEARLTTKL